MNAEGKLFAKFDTTQVSDTFNRRDFVVEIIENPLYPQLVTFQCTQDRVGIIDNFKVGDAISVTFNFRGRKWVTPQGEEKYFNTLEAWRVEAAENSGNTPASTTPVYDMADLSGPNDELLPF